LAPKIGGESTDVIMLVMNRRGIEKLATDKFTIGGDASAAAGLSRSMASGTNRRGGYGHPVARGDSVVLKDARIFAGISLDGTVVSQESSEDRKLYGREVRNQSVLMGEVPAPGAARALISELDRYSPGKH
jgi:SH3 domain-containing YSC84-like protein 1